MAEIVKTMKLHLRITEWPVITAFREITEAYRLGCNAVSEYIFQHDMTLSYPVINTDMYHVLREEYCLKSQFAQSASRTVIARYKTIMEQLKKNPYRYPDEDGKWHSIPRTLEWLQKPVLFSRPQADFVRGRDYSFVRDKITGHPYLSVNTLRGRVRVDYDVPKCFAEYFDKTQEHPWSFGTAKLVSVKGEWYFHIPMTREEPDVFDASCPKHVVGIDRGLRFLTVAYDEQGRTFYEEGQKILAKRESFLKVRSELQSRGTASAKKALKRISGRENRWMTDVNHRISKTLVDTYGPNTLFVLEDLAGVSFDEQNLSTRTKQQRNELRSWAFYQLGQMLTYKAHAVGSEVLEVDPHYTSQRCPKCGRIRKENRNHETHEYVCDCCGFRSNDDRVGAMNIQMLGTMYVSGDSNPRFGKRKIG